RSSTSSAAARTTRPTTPSSANVSMYRECPSRTTSWSGRCSYQMYSYVPDPLPSTGCRLAASHATRSCSVLPFPETLKRRSLRSTVVTGAALNRSFSLENPAEGPPAATSPTTTHTSATVANATSTARAARRETTRRRATKVATHAAPHDTATATSTTAARRCPSRVATSAPEPIVVSASCREAYATHAADGIATTRPVQTKRSRRGSSTTVATRPITSAAHAPRENVR